MRDNELIAEFMLIPRQEHLFWIGGCWVTLENLDYHKSWDSLIPVLRRLVAVRGFLPRNIHVALHEVNIDRLFRQTVIHLDKRKSYYGQEWTQVTMKYV